MSIAADESGFQSSLLRENTVIMRAWHLFCFFIISFDRLLQIPACSEKRVTQRKR